MKFDIVKFGVLSFSFNAWGLEVLSVVLADFEGVLDENGLEVGGYFSLLDHEIEKEGFSQEFLGLEFDLIIHFFTEINLASIVSGYKIDDEFPAMIIFANNREFNRVIKHISQGFGGEESPTDE